jgi:hypothetical protein
MNASLKSAAPKDAVASSADLDRTAVCLEALGQPVRLAVYRALVRAGPEGPAFRARRSRSICAALSRSASSSRSVMARRSSATPTWRSWTARSAS